MSTPLDFMSTPLDFMSTPIDSKAWSAMQARAALAGMQLLRSEGASVVVVLIDRKGVPVRVHTIEELEDHLRASEFARAPT